MKMDLLELVKLKNEGVDLNEFVNNNLNHILEEIIDLQDGDIDGSYIHTSVPNFDYSKSYGVLSDDTAMVIIPKIELESDCLEYNFNEILIVNQDFVDCCDSCKNKFPKDLLINLYPEINMEMDDLKDECIDVDGMFCFNCYSTFCK